MLKQHSVIQVFTFFSLLVCGVSYAQTPGLINYQAVARNTLTGEEIANQSVFLSAILREGGPSGTVVYQEEHPDVMTNTFGLFNLQIGGGEAIMGNLLNVNWGEGSYWLEIELDAGNGLESVGSMQMLSVPYALHAHTVSNTDDADADPANELVELFEFDTTNSTLSLQEAGNEFTVELNSLINDADADPSNELITQFQYDAETFNLVVAEGSNAFEVNLFSLSGDTDPANELVELFEFDADNSSLSLQDVGNLFTVDLSPLIDDADADPTNELITGLFYSAASNTLTISEGGQNFSAGLGPVDFDIDPSNELIDTVNLSPDFILTITEAGIGHDVDLTPLTESLSWSRNETESWVYNENDNIGIGASSPNAKLQVVGDGSSNATILSIDKEPGQSLMQVSGNTVRSTPLSAMRIEGSIAYSVAVVQAPDVEEVNYVVTDADSHIIVLRNALGGGSTSPTNVIMPPAADNPGRIITIRKLGEPPLPGTVKAIFEENDFEFVNSEYTLVGFDPTTSTFLSLGELGWTRLSGD